MPRWTAIVPAGFLLTLCVVVIVPSLRSQQNPPQYIFQTDSRIVRVYAVVFDKEGRLATGLTRDDFQVLDDGVPQPIVNFSNNLREPVSIVVDADVSQSMARKLSFVREALKSLLQPYPDANEQAHFADEFSLVRFATRAEVETPFLVPGSLQNGINGYIQPTRGSTALFDSIYVSADQIERNASNKRQAIILVTDGADNHSRYSLRETRKFLEEADVPVFAVMASPTMQLIDLFSGEEHLPRPAATREGKIQLPTHASHLDAGYMDAAERRGPHTLRALAEATGGEMFTVRKLEELPSVVESIALALRYSHLIGYEMPTGASAPHSKGWDRRHVVSVRLVPQEKYGGYLVNARSGYYENGN